MVGAPFIRLGQKFQLVAGMISLRQRPLLYRNGEANRVEALQQMIPAHRFRVIHARNVMPVAAVMAELLTHPLIHEPMPEKTGSTQYVQLNRTESCKTGIYPSAQDKLRLI